MVDETKLSASIMKMCIVSSTLACMSLAACSASENAAVDPSGKAKAAEANIFEGPLPRAVCGEGSVLETDIQGRVPIEDRESGRSQLGYRCNLELVGQYQGQGTTWVSQSYDHCAYHSQTFPVSVLSSTPGVHVVDVRDPTHPVLATRLTSPAFLGNTWESLKVNEARGLLAGVQAGVAIGAVFFDVYDIKEDCLNPKLLNSIAGTSLSIPANLLGHEGNWSPDGNTYWSTSTTGGLITAIDVSNPALPRIVLAGFTPSPSVRNHGFELSDDGNRLYLANLLPSGLQIFDVSEVQQRKANPQIHPLGSVDWTDGTAGQHTLSVTWGGKPYLIFVDESGAGAARIIDISDEMAPRVVSKLKLEIHMPEHAELRATDTAGTGNFGYEGHYCTVDRKNDPTAVACGYFQSGVRVFDIRDPMSPREIAYYNPPAQVGKNFELTGSEHASGLLGYVGGAPAKLTADWCSSPPRFVEQGNGEQQLWVTCQDNGFMVLKFTNGAYPISNAQAPAEPIESPAIATDHSKFGGVMGWSFLAPLLLVVIRRRTPVRAAIFTVGLVCASLVRAEGHAGHHHGTLEVSGTPPTLGIKVEPDSMTGWNLQLITTAFRFAPEHVGGAVVPNEGHAHLHVDGKKVARLYGPWFHLESLASGPHVLRVTLNANSHEELNIGGKPIEASIGVVAP